jgi:beta propeller repeat protein
MQEENHMMSRKLKLVLILTLVGMLFSIGAKNLEISFNSRQITFNNVNENQPITDGNSIVWTTGYTASYGVVHYDINTGIVTELADDTYANYDPQVQGNYVTWYGNHNGDNDIFLWEVTSDTTTILTSNNANDSYSKIDGDYVIWQSDVDGDKEIYLYQISSGITIQITNNSSTDENALINGDYITWQGDEDGDTEIYLYQISTGITNQITDNSTSDQSPIVDGDYVIWLGNGGTTNDIFCYQMSVDTTRQLTHDVNPNDMSIDDGHVIWNNEAYGNGEVFLHDIGANTTLQVTNDGGKHLSLGIDGDYIIWDPELIYGDGLYAYQISTGIIKNIGVDTNKSHEEPYIKNDIVVWFDHTSVTTLQEVYLTQLSPIPFTGNYEEDHSYIEYSGNWSSQNASEASGGAFTSTIETSASAIFNFSSQLFSLFFTRDSNFGQAEILIDDGAPILLDQYSSSPEYQVRWTSPQLTNRPHSLKIQPSGGGNEINIDAFVVSNPPPPITLEATNGYSSGSVHLTWQVPEGDELYGPVIEYVIRYASTRIDSENAWDAAADIDGEPEPLAPGSTQSFIPTGLPTHRGYYFAIRAADEAGNLSDLTNSPYAKDLSRSYIVDAPFQISENISTDSQSDYPSIDGNYLVWAGPGEHNSYAEIYLFEISTGLISRLTTNDKIDNNPRISGGHVAWVGNHDGDSDIFLHQISSNTTKKVTENNTLDQYAEIAGDYIVWKSDSYPNCKISLYKISTNSTLELPGQAYCAAHPNTDGVHVVWEGTIDEQDGLYLYNIQTENTKKLADSVDQQPQVSGDVVTWVERVGAYKELFIHRISIDHTYEALGTSGDNQFPQTNGDHVVWQGTRDSMQRIIMHQPRTGWYFYVNDDEVNGYNPRITDDYVVWIEDRLNYAEIILYQISTRSYMQITNNNAWDDKAVVDDNHIVWRNNSDGDYEIYMYTIGSNMPGYPYQESNSNITYSGNWNLRDDLLASGEVYRITNQTDASASFTFSGRQISLVYTSGPDFGDIEIVIDGDAPILLNQFAAELNYQNQWDGPLLDMGTHTVIFRHPGGSHMVNIDALLVASPDDIAPNAVELTASTGAESGEVDISWTAPGDDGNTGTAAEYILRYADAEIDTQAKWDAATDVTSEPVPQIAGSDETLTLSGLAHGQTLYFALRTLDDKWNLSYLSNSPSAVVKAPSPVGPGTYENEDASIIYTGNWSTIPSPFSSGGSNNHSNDPAASASLSFYGGQVSLLYTGNTNRGEIQISIDGSAPEILDQYTSASTYQKRWDSQLLDTSLHTITLSHPGDTTTIDLDALIVAPHNPAGSLIKSINQLTIDGDVFTDDFPYVDGDYAVWTSNNQDTTKIYLHQISTGITTQIGNEGLLPKVSGNHVIWSGCGGICLYHIDIGTTTNIEDASMEYPQEPFIDGDNIVWSSDLDDDVEIYLYQISTGTKTQITNNSTVEYYPYIQGDSIVWAGMTNGHDEIFLHQISTGTTTQISNTEFELNWWPQPSGDYVVWFGDDYDGDSEIMLYQISNGTTTQITDNAIDDDYPEIDGNYIVWGQNDGSHFTRHLYAINTGQTKQISPDSTYASRTRNIIKGDFVTWSNFAGYPAEEDECYLYQISTDTLNLVAENSLGSPYPHLSEAHLVWNANYDIFLAELDIPEDTPPATVSLNAATGTYPGEVDLSWTAPGEDGNTGTATEYIVRYADAEIDTQAKWDAASDVTGEPVPQIAGTEESMTVSSLSPGQTYYFALRTLDESGNLSDLSNSPSVEIQVPPPVGPGTYENDDVHIISTGTWNIGENANASGGSTRYSSDPEASATLLFYGGQVSLIFTGDTDRGDVEILIDDKLTSGIDPDVVNQYSNSTTFQNRWDSPLLDNGLHNITVQHPGGADKIDLDAFIIAEHNPTASIVESIDQLTINDTINTMNDDWHPDIAGDYVVWEGSSDISGIFLQQISTGITIKISDGGTLPQIDGNYVVWDGDGVMLHQIDTGVTAKIADENADQFGVHIEGDYVVWANGTEAAAEIYLYQISTGVKTQLTNNAISDAFPDIDGDYVVWEGNEPGSSDIYLYQLSSGTTTNITNNQNGSFGAHISGDYVVWVSSNPVNVYLYDIQTAITTQITNDSIDDWIPCIDANYVVWLKSTADTYTKDIYLYKIDTGISKNISSTGTPYFWDYHTGPFVKDDFVFWMGKDGSPENDNEVYLYQISTDTIHNISDNLDSGDGHAELDGNHLVWSGDYEIYLATLDTSDTIPPAAVTLNAATGSETGEVDLDWIAPGDNANTGTATEYILRYADTAINNQSAWDAAADVAGEPMPQVAGSAETLTLSGLTPGQTYFFALRTLDEAGNLSDLSNSPSAETKAPTHPGVGTYEENSPFIVSNGTWHAWSDVNASGGSFVYTNEPGASASLTFTGRQVTLVFNKYTNRGDIEVVIDGGAPVLFSQYNSTLSYQSEWASPILAQGTHTVTFSHPGGTHYIDIDALIVSTFESDPPAAVVLTAVTGSGTGQVDLSWNAPGDDDTTGTATSYIVRYADSAITNEGEWDAATDVTGEPAPQSAGTAEAMTVSGLTPGETYFFALRTQDEVPNISDLSNSPSAAAQAYIPPGAGTYEEDNANITYSGNWTTWDDASASGGGLVYTNETGASASLTFTGRQVKLVFTRYMNRGNIEITIDGGAPVLFSQYSPALSYQSEWTSPILAQGTHTVTFSHPGGTHYIDIDALIVSTFESDPPAAVVLTAVTGSGTGQVDLSWNAPGDDDTTGTATSYIVRYADSAITNEGEWDAATDVTGEPAPQSAGTAEAMTVSGLTPGETYFFALRTQDEVPNISDLSNSPSAAAQAYIPPGAGTYEEDNANITYSGNWTTWDDASASGGGLVYTNETGASASLTFTGRQVKLVFTRYMNRGNIEITIDGGAPVLFSQYSPALSYQSEWTSPILAQGTHTVTFSHPGGTHFTDIDALIVATFESDPPAAVVLTAVTGSGTGQVDLSWNAPGDDGTTGTATSYIVRYADSAITNEGEWDAATDVTGEPAPQNAGTPQTMVVSGLVPGETYYFALRALDDVGNISDLSNSPSADAQAPVPVGAGTYEEDDAAISYSGTWHAWSDGNASGGALVYTNAPGASATLTFTGRQIKLVFTRYVNRGNVEITIDGGAPVLFSQYNSTLSYQSEWASPILAQGTHTVTFSHPGGDHYIDIDAIMVLE